MSENTANPKRNLRFLVIYILLLFSISSIFLVTSHFANRNENMDRMLFEITQERDELLHELTVLANDKVTAISKLDDTLSALTQERDELQESSEQLEQTIEQLEEDLAALRITHESYVAQTIELRERIEELEAELESLAG